MKFKKGMLALITGGSSGIGLEYARQLAAKGCRLLLVSNRSAELESAAAELKSDYGVNAITLHQDLAVQDAAERLHDFCEQNSFHPDILVCNAGMFFFHELKAGDTGKANAMVNLHVMTNTKLVILFGNDMKKRGSGSIILMSSLAAKLPVPGISIYSATKSYLLNFGKAMWFELHRYGVDLTTVCPAAIATSLYGLKPSLMKLGVRSGVIKTTKWLVRRAIRAAENGRRCIRPAFMNFYMPVLLNTIPARQKNKLWIKFGR